MAQSPAAPYYGGWGGRGYAQAQPRMADPPALQSLAGQAMGTTWSVRLQNPRFEPLAPVRAAIEGALDKVVRQMSHWDSGSALSCFNGAPTGSWQVLEPEFFEVLACALDYARASGGAWDPTVAPLVALWGFGPHAILPRRIPDAEALATARARMGWHRIALDTASHAACQPGGAQLDFSGIAKGYSVDLVAHALQAMGFEHFLVEVGGELRACGSRPGGQPWRVAVAGLPGQEPPFAVTLHNQAVATSGDHWHAYEQAGRRYSHTIDPRTGCPVAHDLSSVTVLHGECMHADALATVLAVLGPEEGFAFARERNVAALFCVHTPEGPAWRATPDFPTP